MHSWLCVGRVQQLPNVGDYMAVTLLDEPLLIVRGKDEKIRAMSALCRHRGHALAEQCTGNAKKFVCPYHRWTYAIDGNLVGAPRMKDAIEIRRLREESPASAAAHRDLVRLHLREFRYQRAAACADNAQA